MSTAAEWARIYFERAETRDLDGMEELMHPELVEDIVALRELHGRDQVRSYYAQLFQAFPNFELRPISIRGDDTHATAQWRAQGTFTGVHFEGIRPTHRRVELRGVDVMEFRDGLLIHNTVYYDGASFARQVGLLPPEDSPPERLLLRTFNKVQELRHRLKV